MIKIFHTGDLHLDSPIKNSDMKRSEAARDRARALFRRMAQHIRSSAYDIVLISGDLYEHGYLTEETAALIRGELGSLGCPVFISPGNHDPFVRGSLYTSGSLPENVFVFGDEQLSHFDIANLGVSVYGYAFTSSTHRENPLSRAEIKDDGSIKLLCAHTEAGVPLSPYAPMSYADMEGCGFRYAALGHIHKAPERYVSKTLTAAYCGFGEGRAFDEIGKGSALSISLFEIGEEIELKTELLSFSDYSFELLPVDISGAQMSADIIEDIEKAIREKGYGEKNAVRIILGGSTDIGFEANIDGILRNCAHLADLIEIKDVSCPLYGAEALEKDITVRGEFYRTMKKKILEGETEEQRSIAAKALKIGLAALDDKNLTSFFPDLNSEKGADA